MSLNGHAFPIIEGMRAIVLGRQGFSKFFVQGRLRRFMKSSEYKQFYCNATSKTTSIFAVSLLSELLSEFQAGEKTSLYNIQHLKLTIPAIYSIFKMIVFILE